MSKAVSKFCLTAIIALSPLMCAAADVKWLHDLDAGKQAAKAQGKDLLVNFTGTEWCHHCIKLKQDVLTRPEFAQIADRFVLVELELAGSEEKRAEPQQQQIARWAEDHHVIGYPTLMFFGSEGRPFATTEQRDLPLQEFIQHLLELQKAGAARDQSLRAAVASTAEQKAAHLDRALSELRSSFQSELQREPISAFYSAELDEIVKLDPDSKLGFKEKWQPLRDCDLELTAIKKIQDKFASLHKSDGAEAAIAWAKSKLRPDQSPQIRKALLVGQYGLLLNSGNSDGAISLADEIATDKSLPEEFRFQLQKGVAHLLARKGKLSEAIVRLDRVIAEVGDHPQGAFYFRYHKAQIQMMNKDHAGAARSFAEANKYAREGTTDWLETVLFEGEMLRRIGKPDESLAAYQRILTASDTPVIYRISAIIGSARAAKESGRGDEALKFADQVETLITQQELPEAERARITKELASIRAK